MPIGIGDDAVARDEHVVFDDNFPVYVELHEMSDYDVVADAQQRAIDHPSAGDAELPMEGHVTPNHNSGVPENMRHHPNRQSAAAAFAPSAEYRRHVENSQEFARHKPNTPVQFVKRARQRKDQARHRNIEIPDRECYTPQRCEEWAFCPLDAKHEVQGHGSMV
ncbi:MAG TPA: hypothetical protein VKB88_41205 [Bryobacteraceae bacterium]|nr:hypothetical protein [Bryobacteraceae bacterium]